jgi:hypothetical protein
MSDLAVRLINNVGGGGAGVTLSCCYHPNSNLLFYVIVVFLSVNIEEILNIFVSVLMTPLSPGHCELVDESDSAQPVKYLSL